MGNQESIPAYNQQKPQQNRRQPSSNGQLRKVSSTNRVAVNYPQNIDKINYVERERQQQELLKQQQELMMQQQRENMYRQQMMQQNNVPKRRMEDIMFERGMVDVMNKQQPNMNMGYSDHPSRAPMQQNMNYTDHPSRVPVQHQQPQQNNGYEVQRYQRGGYENNNMDVVNYGNRRDYENLKLNPYQFNDEIEEYQKQQEEEKNRFEEDERKRRNEFNDYINRRTEYLNREIKRFEENYNPFEILQLPDNHYVKNDIKKSYKKLALKYHPDKAGPEYANKFQLITQAYIYLLNKCEQSEYQEERLTRKVTKQEYRENEESVEGVHNIYINKDKFNINQFNEIFEKYHTQEEENETGYGELYNQRDDEVGDDKVFTTKLSKDIFNANFDDIKKNKRSTDVIEYYEPEALVSTSNMNFTELGRGRMNDYSGQSSLAYTDYKKAHLEDNTLIDASKVKYKEYKNLEQLKMDREGLTHQATNEDELRYKAYERIREEKERNRLEKLREQEARMENNFKKINQKLIVHKRE